MLDNSGKLIRWNSKTEKLFGLTQQELSGRSALDIYEPDRPDIEQKIEETFRTGHSVSEIRLETKEGLRSYSLTGEVVNTPKGRGIIGIGLDVTERKKAELRLRRERDFSEKLLDTAPVIVLILDPKGHIVRYNRYMEQLCGYPLESVRGREWFSLFLPEATRDKTRSSFLEALSDIDV
ncbi:MAG: PAS domain-containing protein [Sulfurimonas sp.]